VKTIHRRIRKLEDRFCPAELDCLLVMSAADRDLALENDRCIEILRECGRYRPWFSNCALMGDPGRPERARTREVSARAWRRDLRFHMCSKYMIARNLSTT